MGKKDYISRLFDYCEQLYTVRADLTKAHDGVGDYLEQQHIGLSIKTVDLIRAMLLYEYELLDTSYVIQDEFLSSYYARRVEILVMTEEQIQGRSEELTALRHRISCPAALDCLDRATVLAALSVELLGDVVGLLQDHIMTRGQRETRH